MQDRKWCAVCGLCVLAGWQFHRIAVVLGWEATAAVVSLATGAGVLTATALKKARVL